MLVAIDCIIFGFDGRNIKLLLIKRGFEPEKGKWSLMGGFVRPDESLELASARILKKLTGLESVFMEQLHVLGDTNRDPVERTISIVHAALIDISRYEKQLTSEYHAEWFNLKEVPPLIFDHERMVNIAKKHLRYKAALHPLLFELLPAKFTIPQLQHLFEEVYETNFDNRNFSRKILSTGLLIRQKEKDKNSSKKGAYYFKLDKRKYTEHFRSFLHFIPNPEKFLKGL